MLAVVKGAHYVPSRGGTLCSDPPPDATLARLAARQHGVVTLEQLAMAGIGPSGARNRVAAGRLHRVHRGVFAVGHPVLPGRGHWMAAVLAYRPDAVLSHRSAAALWGLRGDTRPTTDISLPRHCARSRPGLRAHASLTLERRDVDRVEGIPCTTVARTLLDLADVLDARGLERAIEQAEVLRIYDQAKVDLVLTRAVGRRGAASLRAVLDSHAEPALTESELEEAFLALCREHGLARPEVAVPVATGEGFLKVDFAWREQRLVVETNGYTFHGHRGAFERDHRRDNLLYLAGWKVRRFTWRQITGEEHLVAATVRAALAEPH